ncbi:hypothetical protein [Macrococcus brunensis]|uniref:hypothetical protein n=1 Tax=Macrococcus brunensis TaxID=198483 RepID=UPI001EF0225A|nr:hypothetical protein [Macrococcus brunensis]ULG73583.1 hypothetical protein MGG13_07700 [Macrococcus brunensis]
MNLKETWQDYNDYFYNTKAPINYKQYRDELNLIAIMTLPVFLSFIFLISLNLNEGIKQSFIYGVTFVIAALIITILRNPVERRMFNTRDKSDVPYRVSHVIVFIGSIIYCLISYFLHQEVQFYVLVLGYFIPSMTTMGNYYLK